MHAGTLPRPSASAASGRYSARVTSTAPSERRCGVVHCTSNSAAPSSRSSSTVAQHATFDASVTRWNIDSPAKNPPIRTPYRPPTSSPPSPRLDAVRPTQLVQPRVRVDERLVDPTVRTARIGARAHHVARTRCRRGSRNAGSRARNDRLHVEAVERDDAARIGRPPREHAVGAHREEPAPVRVEHRARLEIATDRDHLVASPRRRIGKLPTRRRRLDRHRQTPDRLREQRAAI